MPSPFPGMNPYLEHESVWHDFHEAFCTACRQALVPQVRPDFYVKLDEQIYVHELAGDDRRLLLGRGDVTVASESVVGTSTATLIQAPVRGTISLAVDLEKESSIQVVDRHDGEVVAVIELLSPTNKRPGEHRLQYLRKRQELLESNAHFVEIDLLRQHGRMPAEGLPACAYCVMVSRVEERPGVALWPTGLRDRLPTIPIPLRGDRRAELDLQDLLNEVYDAAGYEDYVYRLFPSLMGADLAWAEELANGTKPR